jgi:hypothetical protein
LFAATPQLQEAGEIRAHLLQPFYLPDGIRNQINPPLRAATPHYRLVQGDRGLAATAAASSSAMQPAHLERRLQQAAGTTNNTADGGTDSDDSDGSTTLKPKRCRPSLVDVARQYPQLRQMVQLAAAGYNAFSVDGGKNFTVFLPTNAALQALAVGVLGAGRWCRFHICTLSSESPDGPPPPSDG